LVNAINETIKESPFVYENVDDPESGVVLKNQTDSDENDNHAGKHSLALGTGNELADYSFANGSENIVQGNYTSVSGENNTSKKRYNNISGKSNFNDGNYNLVNGLSNTLNGDNNIVSGSNNVVTSNNSVILGDSIYARNVTNITGIGESINFNDNTTDAIGIGKQSRITGDKAISIGSSNVASVESITIGNNNETEGPGNVAVGHDNSIACDDSFTFGSENVTRGDYVHIVGKNNKVTGNSNYVLGANQTIEGTGNTTISAVNKVKANNAIVIGEIDKVHDGATHLGGEDVYIKTHNTESKLQELIFVNLNDWCKQNNASSLNGEKFLDT
jgi:hypothetical protein